MTKAQKALERKVVEVRRQRVPLTKLFNGKEFREGLADLDKWRCDNLNEDEILYGRKLKWRVSYGDTEVIVWRHETDAEYDARQEKNRVARERREQAALKKAEKERIADERKAKLAEDIKAVTVEKVLAAKGWTTEQLVRALRIDEKDLDKLVK